MALTLIIPNTLAHGVTGVERLYGQVMSAPQAACYQFNMQEVSWVEPYGAIALILAARYLAQRSGRPVRVANLKQDVHLYLKRMDILDSHYDWMQSTEALSEEWLRNPQTPNLLELTPIGEPKDVETVILRARQVFNQWLARKDLDSLLTVLSEVCANIYQHSGDRHGCVLIQTYRILSQGKRTVCLAVGDLGCGIQASIVRRHGEIGAEPLDYLQEAMRGRTSRMTGRGGLGLQTVRRIACESGGYMWLRSDTASILSQAATRATSYRNLVPVAGTQLAIELQAPLYS